MRLLFIIRPKNTRSSSSTPITW